MKKKIQILIKSVIFIALLCISIVAASIVLCRKDSIYKYEDFFEEAEKGHIDVLFMGSSHVINAINPVVLFDDYGYTSYNMGGHGAVLQATYWELLESLEYCDPSWVVVDAYMLEKNIKYLDDRDEYADESEINTSVEQLHLNMDAWPLDKLKIAAINDLIQDKDIRNQFLFNFIVYHNRWEYVGESDFKALTGNAGKNSLFGAEMRYDVDIDPVLYPAPSEEELLTEQTVGCDYLEKIIDECQRRGIGVVVTYYPFAADTKDKAAAIKAGEIAAEYDVPYINMLDLDVIDLYSDMNDRGHLNATGSKKVTDYMGEWLSHTGDLIDHRGDEEYSYWQDCVCDYDEALLDALVSEDNLFVKLNLLKLEDFSFVLYVNEGSNVFNDDALKHLIMNISGTDEVDITDGPYIMIKDSGTGELVEGRDEEQLGGVLTGIGTMNYQPVEQYFRLLYSDEDPDTNYLYDDSHVNEDIQLIIYDSETGEIYSHDYYNSYGGNYER